MNPLGYKPQTNANAHEKRPRAIAQEHCRQHDFPRQTMTPSQRWRRSTVAVEVAVDEVWGGWS